MICRGHCPIMILFESISKCSDQLLIQISIDSHILWGNVTTPLSCSKLNLMTGLEIDSIMQNFVNSQSKGEEYFHSATVLQNNKQ